MDKAGRCALPTIAWMLAKLLKAWAVAATEMQRGAEAGIHSLGVEIKANLCPFYHSKKISDWRTTDAIKNSKTRKNKNQNGMAATNLLPRGRTRQTNFAASFV
jgi:hypothetical protein